MDTDARSTMIQWRTPQARWVLAATVGASGLAMLDATTVNVALPAIGTDLGAEVAGLQWTVNAYTLTLATLILLAGSLSDRYGRRRVFQIGIVWFGGASLWCALAPTLDLLVVARAFQGVGGALLTPGSLAILQTSFAPEDRARAVGAWSGLGGIAAAIGPLLGGWLVGAVSWRAIFWINPPIALLVWWISTRHVPESRGSPAQAAARFDIPGAVSGAAGLGALTWALIAAGDQGASKPVLLVGALGGAALIGFMLIERRASHPMVPLDLFRSRQFSAVNLVTLVVYGGMAGQFFLLVVYLQEVAGYSPLAAGTALLPITVLMLLLSARAGSVAEQHGPRRLMTMGPLVMAAGMLLLARIGRDASYLADVLPGATVFGLGLSATVAPLTATVLASADQHLSGVASGVNNAVARSAALLAVAMLPVVAGITGDALHDPTAFASGFRTAMHISAALVALGGVVSWFAISDRLRAEEVAAAPIEMSRHRFCAVCGPPLEHATVVARPDARAAIK